MRSVLAHIGVAGLVILSMTGLEVFWSGTAGGPTISGQQRHPLYVLPPDQQRTPLYVLPPPYVYSPIAPEPGQYDVWA